MGAEAKFLGSRRPGHDETDRIWHDETMGAEYSIEEIPADLLETAKTARAVMIEAVADSDDDLIMNLYLEGQDPTEEQLKKGIRKATIAMNIFPVLCGFVVQEQGCADAARRRGRLSAQPARHPSGACVGHNPDNMEEEIIRKADDSEPLSALGFKIMTDPFVGQLIVYPCLLGHRSRPATRCYNVRAPARANVSAAC